MGGVCAQERKSLLVEGAWPASAALVRQGEARESSSRGRVVIRGRAVIVDGFHDERNAAAATRASACW